MTVLSINDSCCTPLLALEQIGIIPDKYEAIINMQAPSGVGILTERLIKNKFPNVVITKNPRDSPDLVIINIPRMSSIAHKDGLLHSAELQVQRMLEYLKNNMPTLFLIICPVRTHTVMVSSIMQALPGSFIRTLDAADISAIHYKRKYISNYLINPLPKTNAKLQDYLESGWTDKEKAFCVSDAYHKGISYQRYYYYNQRQIIFTKPYIPNMKHTMYMVNHKFNYTSQNMLCEYRKLTPNEICKLMELPQDFLSHVSSYKSYLLAGNVNHVGVLKSIFKNFFIDKYPIC